MVKDSKMIVFKCQNAAVQTCVINHLQLEISWRVFIRCRTISFYKGLVILDIQSIIQSKHIYVDGVIIMLLR